MLVDVDQLSRVAFVVTRLRSVDVRSADIVPGGVRLQADIESDAGRRSFWIEFPAQYERELSTSGDPWLLVMAALAAQTGEGVESDLPVDGLLLENVGALLRIWAHWHCYARSAEVHAPVRAPEAGGDRTMCFFSGGVDSFFSVLRRVPGAGADSLVGQVDDLLTMLGLDLLTERADEFAKMLRSLQEAASQLGLNLIWGATNLRSYEDTLLRRAWGPVTNGIGLGFSALALQKRFRQAIIPSSYCYTALTPRGSHPLTDVLFSTSGTSFLHDGSAFTRCEKTELIARSEIALRHLRVCWEAQTAHNCGHCNKCMRALATFDALGALDRVRTFDVSRYSASEVARVYLTTPMERQFFSEIRELAQRVGRSDLVVAIDRSLARSRMLGPVVSACERAVRQPGLGRVSQGLRSLALSGSVH